MSPSFEVPENRQLPAERTPIKDMVGRTVLTLGLTIGMVAAEVTMPDMAIAVPGASSYPDDNAPCVANAVGETRGEGYWCSGYQWGYYVRNSQGQIIGSSQNSSRGYGYRNCTDWAAFRIPQLLQRSVPLGWGNAKAWDDKAKAGGFQVDAVPEPGDIAVWNSGVYGHVEVVESVNPDMSVNTSGYNKKQDGVYRTQSSVRADQYIDLNGSGKGINGQNLTHPAPEMPALNPYAVQGVSVAQNALGGLSIFTASSSGRMGYKDQLYSGDDLRSKTWGEIQVSVKGVPEIVTHPNGALSVFSHGTDGRLHHSWQTGPGESWPYDISPWDVSLRGDPSAVFNYTGGVSVFVPDSNGAMREIDQIGAGSSMLHAPVHNLEGNFQGKPATINVDGSLAVFARGADNYLYTKYQLGQSGSWSNWELLGGDRIKGDPKVFVNRLGGLTVMAIGAQGDILGIDQLFKGESMNKPFYSLGKPSNGMPLRGTPAILQTTHDEQMVFATGEDGSVYHRGQVQANNYQWTGYFTLGGSLIGSPTVVRNSADGATLLGRTTQGRVVSLDQPNYGVSFNASWNELAMP